MKSSTAFPKLLLCLFIILIFQNCDQPAQQSSVPGVTDSTIVIGSWGPLTGPAALWGNVTKAMDAYFKMLNQDGGIHGRKVKFIYKDDEYNPSKTAAVVREMAQKDEVFAFLGGIGTAPGMAVKQFIIDNEIPWVSPCSGATHWAYPPSNNIFSTFTLYFDEGEVQVDHVVNQLGKNKIGIIYQNDDFGKSGLISAQQAAKKYGAEIVAEVSTEIADTDLASHAARLKDSGAEVVLLWVLPTQAAIILGTTKNMGYEPAWISSSVLSDMALMHNITKGLWEGVTFGFYGIMPSDDHVTIHKYKTALEKYQPGVPWGAFSASGFQFTEPLVEGLKLAGKELTRASFIKAMESIKNFQGTGPVLSFGPDQRQGHRSLFLVKCISATEYDQLTDFKTSTADIQGLIDMLGGSI